MKLTPQKIRLTTDGVKVRGYAGDVLLRKADNGISAQYLGQQLVNGSAGAYAQRVLEAALRCAAHHPLPWSVSPDGGMRIHDHSSFYEQTIQPVLSGVETLAMWQSSFR